MQGTVKWVDDVMFVGESGSGHSVVMDGPPELGGRNHGLRPMEMLLLGTGGCALFDVVTMLKKARQDILNCRVELQAERAGRCSPPCLPLSTYTSLSKAMASKIARLRERCLYQLRNIARRLLP
jgi:hypothetical protein